MTSSPITVLHVDDQREFLEVTEAFLGHIAPDLSYRSIETPVEVFDHLDRGEIDCLVSDYDMPGIDGLTLLSELRDRGNDVPFILFTGKGSEEVASEAISAGAADYLQKGTDSSRFELLVHSVRKAAEQYRNERLVRQVYDAMHLVDEGVSLVDEDGRFVYVNRSYAERFGYEPDELVGRHWSTLYRDEDDASYIEREVMTELSTERSWDGQTLHERRDGSLFYADHYLGVSESGLTVCRVKHERDVGSTGNQSLPVVADGGGADPSSNPETADRQP